ncbi:MAG: NAD(P)-dependent oxidoreductase [Hyphomonadaceae bacterium]|nr:NAD(P)-dependent oxidoreductase [Hyphomonadaceae bacterium]
MTKVALIGFGEVGQIIAEDLPAEAEISVFDLLFAAKDSIPSRALTGHRVRAAANAADAARGADLVICAVTAAETLDAARATTPGVRGATYIDLNSASPGAKRAAGAVIEAAGGRYVEAAVMTSYPTKRIASPMLLGGPHAQAFLDRFGGLGFSATVFSEEIGKASATKMCRSVMIKGVEALLAESMLTARANGVEDAVLASLGDLLPSDNWHKLAQYMISRSLQHGKRRAEEMREAARTVAEADIAPLMSEAIAARQDWAATQKDALAEGELERMLDAILKTLKEAPIGKLSA